MLDRQLAFRVEEHEQYGMIALACRQPIAYIYLEEKLRMTEGFLKLIHKHRSRY